MASPDIVTLFGVKYDCTKLDTYELGEMERPMVADRCRGEFPPLTPNAKFPAFAGVIPSCATQAYSGANISFCNPDNDIGRGNTKNCLGPGELYAAPQCQPRMAIQGVCRWRKFCDEDARREAAVGMLTSVLSSNSYAAHLQSRAAAAICTVNRTAATWERFSPATVATVDDMINIRALGVLMADTQLPDETVTHVADGGCLDKVKIWSGEPVPDGEAAPLPQCRQCLEQMAQGCSVLDGLLRAPPASEKQRSFMELLHKGLGCDSAKSQLLLARLVSPLEKGPAQAAFLSALNGILDDLSTASVDKIEPILLPLARLFALEVLLPAMRRAPTGSSDCILSAYAEVPGSQEDAYVSRVLAVRSLLRSSPTYVQKIDQSIGTPNSARTPYAFFVQMLRPLEHIAHLALSPQDGFFTAWVHNDFVSVAMSLRDHFLAGLSAHFAATSGDTSLPRAFQATFCAKNDQVVEVGKNFHRISPFLSASSCKIAMEAIRSPTEQAIQSAVAKLRSEPLAVSVGAPRALQLFAIFSQVHPAMAAILPDLVSEILLGSGSGTASANDARVTRPGEPTLVSGDETATDAEVSAAEFNAAIRCQLFSNCSSTAAHGRSRTSHPVGRRLLAKLRSTLKRQPPAPTSTLQAVEDVAMSARGLPSRVDTAVLGAPSHEFAKALDLGVVRKAFSSALQESDDGVPNQLPGSGSRRLGVAVRPRSSLDALVQSRAAATGEGQLAFPATPAPAGGVLRVVRGQTQFDISELFTKVSSADDAMGRDRNSRLLRGVTHIAEQMDGLSKRMVSFTTCRCEQSVQEGGQEARLLGTQARVERITPCWENPLASDCTLLSGFTALRQVSRLLASKDQDTARFRTFLQRVRADALDITVGHVAVERSRTEVWPVPFSLLPDQSPLTHAVSSCTTRACLTASARVQGSMEVNLCCNDGSKIMRSMQRLGTAMWHGFKKASQDATNRRKVTLSDTEGCHGCKLVWATMEKRFPVSVRASMDMVALQTGWRTICEGMVSVFVPVCKEMESSVTHLLADWRLNDTPVDDLCTAFCPPAAVASGSTMS